MTDDDFVMPGSVHCPTCLQKHLPAGPCIVGLPRYPALYAEAAVRAEFLRLNAGIPNATVGRHLDVSDEFIRQVRAGTRRPSRAILAAVGFERVVFYRRVKQ